jgi:hypothetical protein
LSAAAHSRRLLEKLQIQRESFLFALTHTLIRRQSWMCACGEEQTFIYIFFEKQHTRRSEVEERAREEWENPCGAVNYSEEKNFHSHNFVLVNISC